MNWGPSGGEGSIGKINKSAFAAPIKGSASTPIGRRGMTQEPQLAGTPRTAADTRTRPPVMEIICQTEPGQLANDEGRLPAHRRARTRGAQGVAAARGAAACCRYRELRRLEPRSRRARRRRGGGRGRGGPRRQGRRRHGGSRGGHGHGREGGDAGVERRRHRAATCPRGRPGRSSSPPASQGPSAAEPRPGRVVAARLASLGIARSAPPAMPREAWSGSPYSSPGRATAASSKALGSGLSSLY